MKSQLGLVDIVQALSRLNEKIVTLSSERATQSSLPEGSTAIESDSGSKRKRPAVESDADNGSDGTSFDPTAPILIEDQLPPADDSTCDFTLASIFEETESFGLEVAEVIAQHVNDACSKKPLDLKLRELEEKYATPQNCTQLCVPRVNLELWHDLPRDSKSKDLGLQ